ncbi:hypothetical protein CHUAL_008015 [Chamberlinius hualienensis]
MIAEVNIKWKSSVCLTCQHQMYFTRVVMDVFNRQSVFLTACFLLVLTLRSSINGLPVEEGLRGPVNLTCSLPQTLIDEIASYRPVAEQIADIILNGPAKGFAYNQLAKFVDKFGPRIVGSQVLENSIDYMLDFLTILGLKDVHTENATVPIWKRNNESLTLLQPFHKPLALLGLGGSVATPPEGITAEVLVVDSFDELDTKAPQVAGKIVVYNEPWRGYGGTVAYRDGANQAARYGALATLTRSVTPFSIYSPHTGDMDYDSDLKIPCACITVEDAAMFRRMADRGDKIVLTLYMEAENLPDGISRNTIADYSGTTYPKEVVIVSGHIDSWDVGQGAMDDGGGVFISVTVPYVLGLLGLQSKRPVRVILWTSEETGYNGAYAYANDHAADLSDFNIVLESDEGTFEPAGLSFSGNNDAACIVQEVLKLADVVNATHLFMPDDGSDSTLFSQLGVPSASLLNISPRYFWYHHSNGDMMTVQDSDQMDRCTVLWSIASYVLADISTKLPRDSPTMSSSA